jgi:uncharacterized OB-fold protein
MKGDFRVPFCRTCRASVWPPFEHCPTCLSKTILKRISRRGILLEYSTSFISGRAQDYGIVDLEGVHLLGSVRGNNIFPGSKVVMYDCGIDENNIPFYKFGIDT